MQACSRPCRNPTPDRRVAWLAALCLVAVSPLQAQETVVPAENVRMDYAQVLRVEPVYQTLRATRMVQSCETTVLPPAATPRPEATQDNGLLRLFDRVRGIVSREPPAAAPATGAATRETHCRMVPENRQYSRPIAYDVDYVYKGHNYRSRLPYDPGNRLKLRVSVTPQLPASAQRSP